MLKERRVRRHFCRLLNEPNIYQPQGETVIAYDMRKWQRLAERCLREHLPRQGVSLVTVSYTTTALSISLAQWPNGVVRRSKGSLVELTAHSDAIGDYAMKPYRGFWEAL
jgi:hypothetical protein